MARLRFDIWSVRKNVTPEFIVGQGVHNTEDLDKYLQERGVAMPQDLTDFENLWAANTDNTSAKASKESQISKTATKSNAAPSKKPAKKSTTRTTRRKSNIKDVNAKD